MTNDAPSALPLDAPLSRYRSLFLSLPPLRAEDFDGAYDGLLLGPAWFQLAFRRMLDAGGLRGWRGKEFHEGKGLNLVERGGTVEKIARMRITGVFPSRLDGQPTLSLGYESKGPLGKIRDEIRRYDERTVLGMTYVDRPVLSALPMPFGLRRRAA
jgi:hypothetical protein